MKVYFDSKPDKLVPIGDGRFRYHWDIAEVQKESDSDQSQTQWSCYEIILYPPITQSKLIRLVINELWSKDTEQKLVNEYLAAKEGLLPKQESDEALAKYKEFLNTRSSVKHEVEADCLELNIPDV